MNPRRISCWLSIVVIAVHAGCSLPMLNKQTWSGGRNGSERLFDDDPATYGMQIAKGRNHESAAQLDKAREVYESLIEDFPNRSESYHRLGIVADRQRRHTEAQELFTAALRLDGQNAQLLNDLGYCFFLQGKLTKAESALAKAVHLDPRESRFLNNLGMVIGHQGRHPEALAQFRKAGSDADAFFNLAYVYASQDDADAAKQCFRQALAVDPGHAKSKDALSSFEKFDGALIARHGQDFSADDDYSIRFQEGSETVQAGFDDQDAGNISTASYDDSESSMSLTQTRRAMHNRAKKLLERNMAARRSQ